MFKIPTSFGWLGPVFLVSIKSTT